VNGYKLSLQYILKLCKVKFYFHLLYAANSLLWICFGCTMVTIILHTIVYDVCLAGDMRPLMLCTSSLKLTIHRSCLCRIFSFSCF